METPVAAQGFISPPSEQVAATELVVTPPTKKARYGRTSLLRRKRADDDLGPCHLAAVPLEILAEILSHVPSSAAVLALARCSKYFCTTLVNNPSTTFIWRQARTRCKVDSSKDGALPEPTPNFTEASYAAFVFDGGTCEVCGKYTRQMFESFCLRARLCDRKPCQTEWSTHRLMLAHEESYPRYKDLTLWLPRSERLQGMLEVRESDWHAAVDEYNQALLEPERMQEYLREKQVLAGRLPAVLELGVKLQRFKRAWLIRARFVKESNETMAQALATQEGWTAIEMISTNSYGMLHRFKTAALETVTNRDFMMIRDTVDRELAEHRERRARRAAEAAYRKRREDVAAHHSRLKSDPSFTEVLPTLPDFRKLSTMKVLQGKNTSRDEGVAKELKGTKLVRELLAENLTQWREDARSALAGVLGFPGWKSTSKNKLHPVDRLTAWFRCKRCTVRGKGGDGLDFASVCAHQCAGIIKKARAKHEWCASLFEPDVKAIEAANQMLGHLDTTPEQTLSKERTRFKDIGVCLICKACPAPIEMTFDIAIRHCKRHDHFDFVFVSPEDSTMEAYSEHPIPAGMTAELMSQGLDAREKRGKKTYSCRHCQQGVLVELRNSVPTTAEDHAPPPASDPDSFMDRPEPTAEASVRSTDTELAGGQTTNATEQNEQATRSRVITVQAPDIRKKVDRATRRMESGKCYSFDGMRSHLKEKHGISQIGDEDFYVSA